MNNIWKCKCGCSSKQSHRSRWSFISRYKKNYSDKYRKINNNLENESSLVNKLRIKRNNTNLSQEIMIPVKKVKFDEITKKIIVETEDDKPEINKSKKIIKSKKNIDNDLIDLRELFNTIK